MHHIAWSMVMTVGIAAFGSTVLAAPTNPSGASDAPLAEKFLTDGKLAEGEKVLGERLVKHPNDDQARFGLGVIQFFRAYERLGAGLYKYGLRTEREGRRIGLRIQAIFPQNPAPEKISNADFRKLLATWVDDLVKAEATLAGIRDDKVKLPLHVGLIKLDITGLNKPISAAALFRGIDSAIPSEVVEKFVIGFDRGDVSWLRGYCHAMCALGDFTLALDTQEWFECAAHYLFEKVETPHAFLLEDNTRDKEPQLWGDNGQPLSDLIAAIHLTLRFPIKEPERMKSCHAHLVAMTAMSKEMWRYILAETDDDNEWIPNPKQKGVMQIAVKQELIDTWLETVDEVALVLEGKKLIPFWRGKPDAGMGINLKRVFTEPRTFDLILYIQGAGFTPYLEKGEVTKFNDLRFLGRINQQFGTNFIGFAFWFN